MHNQKVKIKAKTNIAKLADNKSSGSLTPRIIKTPLKITSDKIDKTQTLRIDKSPNPITNTILQKTLLINQESKIKTEIKEKQGLKKQLESKSTEKEKELHQNKSTVSTKASTKSASTTIETSSQALKDNLLRGVKRHSTQTNISATTNATNLTQINNSISKRKDSDKSDTKQENKSPSQFNQGNLKNLGISSKKSEKNLKRQDSNSDAEVSNQDDDQDHSVSYQNEKSIVSVEKPRRRLSNFNQSRATEKDLNFSESIELKENPLKTDSKKQIGEEKKPDQPVVQNYASVEPIGNFQMNMNTYKPQNEQINKENLADQDSLVKQVSNDPQVSEQKSLLNNHNTFFNQHDLNGFNTDNQKKNNYNSDIQINQLSNNTDANNFKTVLKNDKNPNPIIEEEDLINSNMLSEDQLTCLKSTDNVKPRKKSANIDRFESVSESRNLLGNTNNAKLSSIKIIQDEINVDAQKKSDRDLKINNKDNKNFNQTTTYNTNLNSQQETINIEYTLQKNNLDSIIIQYNYKSVEIFKTNMFEITKHRMKLNQFFETVSVKFNNITQLHNLTIKSEVSQKSLSESNKVYSKDHFEKDRRIDQLEEMISKLTDPSQINSIVESKINDHIKTNKFEIDYLKDTIKILEEKVSCLDERNNKVYSFIMSDLQSARTEIQSAQDKYNELEKIIKEINLNFNLQTDGYKETQNEIVRIYEEINDQNKKLEDMDNKVQLNFTQIEQCENAIEAYNTMQKSVIPNGDCQTTTLDSNTHQQLTKAHLHAHYKSENKNNNHSQSNFANDSELKEATVIDYSSQVFNYVNLEKAFNSNKQEIFSSKRSYINQVHFVYFNCLWIGFGRSDKSLIDCLYVVNKDQSSFEKVEVLISARELASCACAKEGDGMCQIQGGKDDSKQFNQLQAIDLHQIHSHPESVVDLNQTHSLHLTHNAYGKATFYNDVIVQFGGKKEDSVFDSQIKILKKDKLLKYRLIAEEIPVAPRTQHILSQINSGILLGMGVDEADQNLNDIYFLPEEGVMAVSQIASQLKQIDYNLLPDEGLATVHSDTELIIFGGFNGLLCKIQMDNLNNAKTDQDQDKNQSMYGGLVQLNGVMIDLKNDIKNQIRIID